MDSCHKSKGLNRSVIHGFNERFSVFDLFRGFLDLFGGLVGYSEVLHWCCESAGSGGV